MRRREFIALAGAAVTWPLVTRAQTAKIPTVGILWHRANADEEATYLGALQQGLKDSGYVDGKNIHLEMRFPAEQHDKFFSLAAALSGNPETGLGKSDIAFKQF